MPFVTRLGQSLEIRHYAGAVGKQVPAAGEVERASVHARAIKTNQGRGAETHELAGDRHEECGDIHCIGKVAADRSTAARTKQMSGIRTIGSYWNKSPIPTD